MDIKTKILVTGGCGFIGSHFIDLLLSKKKYYIINVDKLTYASNREYSKIKNKNYRFYKLDICNKKRISKIINKYKPEILINFAAESHVDQSIKSPEKFFLTNVIGTISLLEASKKNAVKKFIQISTDEVFGDPGRVTNENDIYFPSSPYSSSKAAADLAVKAWARTYKINFNITYSCNNYGPRQNKEKLIPTIIKNIIRNKTVPIYDKGLNIREWIYVKENVNGILHVIESGKNNESYNIGSGNRLTNLKTYYTIFKILEAKLKKKIEKKIKYINFRPGHDKMYAINSNKINKIGWKNKVSFEKGLNETIQWFLSNKK